MEFHARGERLSPYEAEPTHRVGTASLNLSFGSSKFCVGLMPGIIEMQEPILRTSTLTCGLLFVIQGVGICQTSAVITNAPGAAASQMGRGMKALFDHLTMAGTASAADFKPLTQGERNAMYLKSLINPVPYLKAGFSAALDHAKDKPAEWEQGGSGYGKRYGNILGQYTIQRTFTFGVSSLLHEDNRYFGSGKKGIWSRTGYAVASSVLARRDSGKRYPSVSLIGGFAAGAFVSRSWHPPSTQSAGDGAVSFGISMGYNALTCAVKEFLPDLVRPLTRRRRAPTP